MPVPPILRVLIADDSARVRRLLADAIAEVDGVEVVAEAADGAATVAQVRDHAPGVVLLDLQRPLAGGLAALQTLRQSGPQPRVIVLTNHTARAYREACLAAGADVFLDKSTEVDRVLDVLREWAGDAYETSRPRDRSAE